MVALAAAVAVMLWRGPEPPPPPLPCHRARSVVRVITCLAERYQVPGGSAKALAVARCESSLDPNSDNGTHVGLYQHAKTLWTARWRKYALPLGLPNLPRDPFVNALVTMRMATDLDIGWDPWSCA